MWNPFKKKIPIAVTEQFEEIRNNIGVTVKVDITSAIIYDDFSFTFVNKPFQAMINLYQNQYYLLRIVKETKSLKILEGRKDIKITLFDEPSLTETKYSIVP